MPIWLPSARRACQYRPPLAGTGGQYPGFQEVAGQGHTRRQRPRGLQQWYALHLQRTETPQTDSDTGKLSVADQEFAVNDEFKHISRAIATMLDLDEIEAGRLVIQSQQDLALAADSLVMDVVSKFHNRRDLLLQCLRITLHQSLTLEPDNDVRRVFETTTTSILEVDTGVTGNGSVFTRKCLTTLEEIEKFQAKVVDALPESSGVGRTTRR